MKSERVTRNPGFSYGFGPGSYWEKPEVVPSNSACRWALYPTHSQTFCRIERRLVRGDRGVGLRIALATLRLQTEGV
jgi:hypothetical protein